MPTLPDLFDRLAAHGDHAGADIIVDRARRAAQVRSVPAPVVADVGTRRPKRLAPVLVAAAVTVALVAVPLAVRLTDHPSHPSRPPSGPPYAPPAAATTEQLARMRWSRIATPPVGLSTHNQVMAWAGDELVVFGVDGLHADPRGVGAAYTPATNTWRRLPRAPLNGDFFFSPSWVWTGRELVVFPATTPDPASPRGEAYSPRTNSWRVLAPAPLCTVSRAGVVWTGRVIVMAGGDNMNGSQCSTTGAARSAVYDPSTDRWTPGPTLPVRRGARLEATRLAFASDRVVAIVGTQVGAASNPPATTPGTAAAGRASTRTAPNNGALVQAYQWRVGAGAWEPIGPITGGLLGETTQDDWVASSNGSQLVLPPSLIFCGDGTVISCSLQGVQAGSAYDVASRRERTLAVPTTGPNTVVDTTVFTGDALVAWIYGGSTSRGYAWDIATGGRRTLPASSDRVLAATWTGHEIVAIAANAVPGADDVMLRLGTGGD